MRTPKEVAKVDKAPQTESAKVVALPNSNELPNLKARASKTLSLFDVLDRLNEAADKLNNIQPSQTDAKAELSISNGEGVRFVSSHPTLIKKVVNALLEEVEATRTATEAEIKSLAA